MKNKVFTFKDHLRESLGDLEFKKVWEESETDYVLACKLIETRMKKNLSQLDLARKIGTSQAAISRIENMSGNPSLHLLKRIADALEVKLQVSMS